MSDPVRSQLAPTGTLRAGINLSNFLLVTGRSASGEPEGVAPDMAKAIATKLGVPLKLVPFKSPGDLADQAGNDVWDIGLIGAEPQRAQKIAFTAAYVEIEATYMVAESSPIKSVSDVDRKGVDIAGSARSAYDLWLENNIKNATLVRVSGLDAAYDKFAAEKLDVLAGPRPALLKDLAKAPGMRILDGKFTAVQQAVGTARANEAGARFLASFVEDAKKSGPVGTLIERHKVKGLSVAPSA